MRLSSTAEYALRATLLLTEREDAGMVPVASIAEALDVPRNYLSKILHQLVRAGILTSTRGPKGGFQLARPPETVRLVEVIDPVDPVDSEPRCLLGRPECSDTDSCSAHARWREVADRMRSFFHHTTLAELARSGSGAVRAGRSPV